jgi:hypothetical protein
MSKIEVIKETEGLKIGEIQEVDSNIARCLSSKGIVKIIEQNKRNNELMVK